MCTCIPARLDTHTLVAYMCTHLCTYAYAHITHNIHDMYMLIHTFAHIPTHYIYGCTCSHMFACTHTRVHTHTSHVHTIPPLLYLANTYSFSSQPKSHSLGATALTSQVRPGLSGCALWVPCIFPLQFAS